MKLKKGSIMKSLKTFTSIAVGSLLISASSLLACEVPVDIHPTSCPNPINVGSKGLVPAAILGTTVRGVHLINPLHDEGWEKGIQMVFPPYYTPLADFPEGMTERIVVQAVKVRYEDVATPYAGDACEDEYSCTENGPDGEEDLTLKFPAQGKWKGDVYFPGVADLLKGLATGETRCVEINAWTYPKLDENGDEVLDGNGVPDTHRHHGLDVVIVK